MSYSQEVYLKAAAVLEDRKRSARLTAAARKEEIYAALPEVRQIDDALRSGAVSMTKLALGGQADLGVTLTASVSTGSMLAQRSRMLMAAGYLPIIRISAPSAQSATIPEESGCHALLLLQGSLRAEALKERCKLRSRLFL
jgi:hypothetical protein